MGYWFVDKEPAQDKEHPMSDAFTVKVKAASVVASTISDVNLEAGGSQDISLSVCSATP